MATLKIILDKRTVKADQTSPFYLRLIHHRKTINIKLGYYLEIKYWNDIKQIVVANHPF